MSAGFRWCQEVGDGLLAAFTGTDEGNLALHVGDDREAVLARRRNLEQDMGVPPGSLRFMDQVHSALVADVSRDDPPGPAPSVDALVSGDGGVPLAVMVADCVPVLLAGKRAGGSVTAAAHAGRAGLLDGVLPATVQRMQAHGAQALRAWIGPAICGHCYEVPEQMQAGAAAALPGIPELISTTRAGTPGLDLPAAAAAQLTALGVEVHRVGPCTLETEGLYSHRRSNRSGRFAGLIWRPGP